MRDPRGSAAPGAVVRRLAAILACVGAAWSTPAVGQSAEWTATLSVPPFPSPYVSEWEANPQNLTLTLLYTGATERTYVIEGELSSARRGLLGTAVSPERSAAPGTAELVTADALFDWQVALAQRRYVDNALRSGVIPEDDYRVCARALTPAGIQLAEACADFTITLPDAPELISPAPREAVTVEQPTFQWTPVSFPPVLGVAYRLRLVERYRQQTPATALAANTTHFETVVRNLPFLLYPPDALPLEAGKEYVWQVEALDGQGNPVGSRGLLSEIRTFRRTGSRGPGGRGAEGPPDALTVVAGLARVEGAAAVEIEETVDGYRYNGTAYLSLADPYRARLRVELRDVVVRQGDPQAQVVRGRLMARVPEGALPIAGAPVELRRLVWEPALGLQGAVSLRTPTGAVVDLDGEVQVTAAGVYGELITERPRGLFEVGGDPVALRVVGAAVRLPAGEVRYAAALDLFGGTTSCVTPWEPVTGGAWNALVSCGGTESIAIADPGPTLALSDITGGVSFSGSGQPGYQLVLNGGVTLGGGIACGIDVRMVLDEGGVSVPRASPACDTSEPLDLGWVRIRPAALSLDGIGYTPGQGFDLRLAMDVEVMLPAVQQVRLPVVRARVTADGLVVPRLAQAMRPMKGFMPLEGLSGDAATELGRVAEAGVGLGAPDLDGAGLGLAVSGFSTPGFTVSWTDWQAGDGRAVVLDLDAGLAMPEGLGAFPDVCMMPVPLASARFADGRFTARLEPGVLADDDCRVTLPGGGATVVRIDGLSGGVAVDLAPDVTLAGAMTLEGRLRAAEPFACAEGVELPVRVSLLPDGTLAGVVGGRVPDCPIRTAGLDLIPAEAVLAFGAGADGAQGLTLRFAGSARFADGATPVEAAGRVAFDLLEPRLVDGRLEFRGATPFHVPRERPLLRLGLASAVLDPGGLLLDGRGELVEPEACRSGVTFDGALFALDGSGLTDGRILFDSRVALDMGIGETGGLSWSLSCPDAAFTLASGSRVELPAQAGLTPDGFTADGEAQARLVYEGRDLAELRARFTDGFALSVRPLDVQAGRLELLQDYALLAHVDPDGFHPNLAFLGTVVPERVGLPAENIAYLQLRDAQDQPLVRSEMTADGRRVYTDTGQSARLVFPALQGTAPEPPSLDIALDVTLDETDPVITAGEIVVSVPAGRQSAFSLAGHGVPVALDSIRYASDGTGYGLTLVGHPEIDGLPTVDGRILLAVDGAGNASADIQAASQGTLELITGGGVGFDWTGLTGSIEMSLLGASAPVWSLGLDGELTVALGTGAPYAVGASLEAAPGSLRFTGIGTGLTDAFVYFDAGAVRLGVGNLAVPLLVYDSRTGWDFELEADLRLQVPGLDDLTLPPVEGVVITPDGFTIPETSAPSLGLPAVQVAGFSIEPLAFRMDPVTVNPFTGDLPTDWGLRFDLAISPGELASDVPAALGDLGLTVLDAGYGAGGFTGTIEPRTLRTPLGIGIGDDGMVAALTELGGELTTGPDGQAVAIDAGIEWTPPSFLDCPARIDPIDLSTAELSLDARGRLSGRIDAVAAPCPLMLGPLTLALTRADLVLAADAGAQQASLELDGELRLPGQSPGDTVTATGALVMDLLGPAITSGSIAITDPFRWGFPMDDPLLTVVATGHLDADGLTLDGAGTLRLGDDPATSDPRDVAVTLDALTFALPTLEPASGSAAFQADLAFHLSLEPGQTYFAVRSTSAPAPTTAGLVITVPTPTYTAPDGFGLGGTGTAAVAFGDTSFTALTASFTDGFRIGVGPADVEAGRAGFSLDQTEVAYLDTRGFHPGDIFGLLPLPDRLPLPTEDIAYIELKDANGNPLVGTASGPDGLELSTGNESLPIVIPALAAPNAAPPTVDAAFSITVNASTYEPVDGRIEVTTPPDDPALLDLAPLGLPVEVRGLAYADDGNGYRLTVDARAALPGSLDDLHVELTDIAVGADGLEGEARVGDYAASHSATDPPVATADLTYLTLQVDGAHAVFGATPSLEIRGAVEMPLFSTPDPDPEPLPFTAALSTTGITLDAELDQLTDGSLPIGVLTFTPRSLQAEPPVRVIADETEFAIELDGVIEAPTLSDRFAVTVEELSVGTGGVALPDVSIVSQGDEQELQLFGAVLTLRDTDGQPAVQLAYQQPVLSLVLSGSLDLWGTGADFAGLRVASDGSLGMESAELAGGITLIPDHLEVTSLAIANDALEIALAADLPAPFDDAGTQTGSVAIAADGTVTGGAYIVLMDEAADRSNAQLQTPLVDAHLRYLALDLEETRFSDNGLEMAGDLYLAGEDGNRIKIGDCGSTFEPGLDLRFDGSVQWSSVCAPQPFEFDFDVLRLSLADVAPAPGDAFGVRISGGLGLDFEVVDGSLEFYDFGIAADLSVDADELRVTEGHLTLADFVRLELNGFGYSATPTTLTVPAGDRPADPMATQADSVDVQVDSYVQFGGSVCVGESCGGTGSDPLFSGGVREFLFYKEQGRSHLMVDSATIDIPEVIVARGDLDYHETSPSTFMMRLGAEAEIGGKSGAMVGVFDNSDGEIRAGLFLSMTDRIEIIPVLLALTEYGGGFFYNAASSDIDMVRSYVGVPDLAYRESPTGKFTGLLYAEAQVVEASVGRAKVLLTLDETKAQLDGVVAMLSPGDGPIENAIFNGSLNLVVNWDEAYAEGNVGMNVAFDPIVYTPSPATVEFFLYGPQQWGVLGDMELEFLGMINGQSDFVIGPPGFYVSSSTRAEFDFWIVSVSSDAEMNFWHLSDNREWGAYGEMGVSASIAGGAVSASGRLRGALIVGTGAPYMYAGAIARGCVVGLCEEASIFARFQDGSVSGGFGNDPGMDRLIARARQTKADMNAEVEGLRTAINSYSPQPGEFDAGAAFLALLAMSPSQAQQVVDGIVAAELGTPTGSALTQHINEYRDLLLQVDAPPVNPTAPGMTLAQLEDTTQTLVQRVNSLRPTVVQNIQDVDAEIEELQQLALAPWPETPVRGASFEQPTTTTSTQDGKTVKTASSTPGFDIDRQAADQARQELEAREQQAAALRVEACKRILGVERGLEQVRTITEETRVGSPLHYGRLHSRLYQAAQEQFARQGDQLLRQRDWLLRVAADSIQPRQSEIASLIAAKTGSLTRTQVESLAAVRADALEDLQSEWDGAAPTTRVDNASSLGEYQALANEFGIDLWYALVAQGFPSADTVYERRTDEVRTQIGDEVGDIRVAHRSMTGEIDALYRGQRELVGILYDLYERYESWLPEDGTVTCETQEESSRDYTYGDLSGDQVVLDPQLVTLATSPIYFIQDLDLNTLVLGSRKEQLAKELRAPSVDDVHVTTIGLSYLSWNMFRADGSHPTSEPYEYLFQAAPRTRTHASINLMQSFGPRSRGQEFLLSPTNAVGGTSRNRTLVAGARGGAGYIGYGFARYTAAFPGGDAPATLSGWSQSIDYSPPIGEPVVGFEPAMAYDTLWTGDPDVIGSVVWPNEQLHVRDPESGISEYEYAIVSRMAGLAEPARTCRFDDGSTTTTTTTTTSDGTLDGQLSSGPTTVDYQSLESLGSWSLERDWASTGAREQVLVLDAALQDNRVYHVLVRARNGQGVASDCGYSPPIRHDPTPPTFTAPLAPPYVYTGYYYTYFGYSEFETLNADAYPACSPSKLSIVDPQAYATPEPDTPRIVLVVPEATDDESGVTGIHWTVSRSEPAAFNVTEWEPFDRYAYALETGNPNLVDYLEAEGEPMNFADSFYVAVAAVNKAGLASAPNVYGPFVPEDPTGPADAGFCIRQSSSKHVHLSVSYPAKDPGSGVAGYRYRLRTETGTILRDWPAQDDWAAEEVEMGTDVDLGPFTLQPNTPYYLDLRARNAQGGTSTASSGPLYVDASPPPMPSLTRVEGASSLGDWVVVVEGNIPTDPQTGIRSVVWRIAHPDQGVVADGQLSVGTGWFQTAFQVPGSALQSGQYTLYLSTVNGVGLSSSPASETLVLP